MIHLGEREKQVLELLLQGCDNAEIAKELGMEVRTVKGKFNKLFLKFGITDDRKIKRVVLAVKVYQMQKRGEL